MSLLAALIAIALLIFLNGLFVAAEFSIIGVRPTRLEQMAEEGVQTAERVHQVLRQRPLTDRYIATAQLGVTLASLGLGMYAEPVITHIIEGPLANVNITGAWVHTISFLLALGLITYLHVVLGEMVPKSLALHSADRMVLVLYGPMRIASRIFAGPVWLLNKIGLLLLRMLRMPPPSENSRFYSPDELEMIVSESRAGGLLEEQQEELVENIFDFTERRAVQVMTPRTRIQAVSVDITEPKLLTLMDESHYTRLPVYDGSMDNIIGVLHIKDLVRQQLSGEPFDLRKMTREVPFVPETMLVENLMAEFRREHLQMAIVLDEHGGTAGLVTMEDLVEEVFGEVRDEFDIEEEAPIVEVGPGEWLVRGDVLLDDLDELVDLGPAHEEYDVETVAGLVMAALGHAAETGEVVQIDGVRLAVEATHGLTIDRVRVQRLEPSTGE